MGKTVFFGVRADDEIVYICKYEPENPIITTATVGTKNPIYCTSLGKAILAYSEEEERLALTERIHFRAFTERTIRDKACFLDELEKVKEKGYALDARELEISVSSLYKPTEDYEALGRRVCEKAAMLSRLLGYIGKR